MPGNNANQNPDHEANRPKRKAAGFPGMEIPEGKPPRSEEEVAEARRRNVAATQAKKKDGKRRRERPF